ncbi:pyridoxal phosphate-dependent aminotransferase [Roseimaritima sediminicola]|uniref:pyridoxal phosphate-dependent aminotransferase n=1 Tax=Roseimaritima sediminicola TaxID=2662066 RepID=UPI0012984B0F|nr:aminotransferase class I/II-fold pyridoxal phosphate-dependent enzyme [Roseimaritima sediminicola]
MNEAIRPVPHGGIDYDELARRGVDPQDVVDLSSNILWTPPAPAVRQAIADADIAAYPDRDCGRLRDALTRHHGIAAERIIVGNGCCEIVHLLAASLLHAGDDVLVVGPTFGEYERASRLAGANVHAVTATADDGFRPPRQAIEECLSAHSYALVWICSPNNPTGQPFPVERLRDWSSRYPRTVFAVDESYLEFSPASTSLLGAAAENLIVLRSMTKYYALAGVRLGYAVASPSLLRPMRDRQLPWSVNALAQAAGVAALAAKSHYDAACERMRTERSRLCAALRSRGYRPRDTDTGFLLLPVSDAQRFRDRLLNHRVLVRDVASMGVERHVRIAVGDAPATDWLLAALDANPPELQRQGWESRRMKGKNEG